MWGVSFSDGVGDQNISMKVPHAPLCISAKVADDPDKLAAVLDFFKFYYSDDGAAVMIENLVAPPTNYMGTISARVPCRAPRIWQGDGRDGTSRLHNSCDAAGQREQRSLW